MKSKSPRLQLNIRLTPQQNELLNKKLQQTNKQKTEFIIDCINQTPIYIIPHLQETLSQIKYLGNQTYQLSQKLDLNNEIHKNLIKDLQSGCDELWRLLKLLKQEKPKRV